MNTPLPSYLQPDCSACCGLCCVVLPFDAEQGFGFDKAAHTPCRHLQSDFRCEIHSELKQQGFSGCVQYNCHGAGQQTTQLFKNISWAPSPDHAEQMFDVFTKLRPVHELLAMLTLALAHSEDQTVKSALQDAFEQLDSVRHNLSAITSKQPFSAAKTAAQKALRQFAASTKTPSLHAAKDR